MHTKPFAPNTHAAWHKTYPKLPILTFSPSTAPRSSNPIPFSAAFWLLKGLSFVTPLPLVRSSPLFLSYAFSPSMMRHSKADNLDLLFSLHSSLAFASRSSPAIVNKLVQGQGEIFSKKNCSSDYHTKTSASGKPNPLLPHELTSSLCAALSHCPNYKDICPDLPTSPMQLAAALEGLQSYPIPDTKGILMHLILPHSLRCPADAYFTEVVSHYPHLYRESDTGELRYGHFEDPLPSISSLRLPVDMQGQTHHISGYRLLHWSPVITQNAHIDRASLDTVLTVAGVLSFFTARSIRLNDENSKLLLLAPHNDTIQDLQDALGTPSPHFPPTLYDFYLTCIFRVMLLPTHISSFARKDHMNQLIEPQPHTISSLDIHHFLSAHPDLINQLLPRYSLQHCTYRSFQPPGIFRILHHFQHCQSHRHRGNCVHLPFSKSYPFSYSIP